MDQFRRHGGYYPPHQPYGYLAAPPPVVNNFNNYNYTMPPVVNNYYNYTIPPDYSNAMHPGYPNAMHPGYPNVMHPRYPNAMHPRYPNAMHPGYPNAMPPIPPGYPYHPPPQPHYWQPPDVYPGTPHEFDADGTQAAWLEQSIEPAQGWTDENDDSAQVHRDFDVVEAKRKVLPPAPKSLPVKPQRISDGSKPSSTNPGGSTAQAGVPSPNAILINKNMLEQPSPKSTSTEHIHVPKHRDTSLRVDTEEHPNLAPFG